MEISINEALKYGHEAHVTGQINEACNYYNFVLAKESNHPIANHNIGLLKLTSGDILEAMPYLSNALEANLNEARYWISYIKALIELGSFQDAQKMLDIAFSRGATGLEFTKLKEKIELLKSNIDNSEPPNEILEKLLQSFNRGRLEDASKDAAVLLKQYPNSLTLYNIHGAAHAGLRQFNIAAESFKKALAIKPDYAEAFNNLGNVLKSQTDFKGALNNFEQAIAVKPDYAEAYNNRGTTLQALGKSKDAIKNYKKAIEIKTDYADAYYNLGNCLKETGDLKSAEKHLQKAIEFKKDYAEAYNNIGTIQQESGSLKLALENYNRAIQINPNYSGAYNNLGNVLKDKGDLEGAIKNFKKAIEISPNYADAYNNLGVALQYKGEPTKAIESFNMAIEINPLADTYNNIGNAFKDNGELEIAIKNYQEALKINPDHAETYNNMGIALKDKGDLDAAINSYNQAIEIDPKFADAHSNLGSALGNRGELDIALDSFSQAIKIEPKYADAYNNMGNVLQEQGDFIKAIHIYKKAIKIRPNFAEAYNNLGVALQNKGEFSNAIKSYKKALMLKPKYDEANINKLFQQRHICDWSEAKKNCKLIPKLGTRLNPIAPFSALPLEDSPERHKIRAEIYMKSRFRQEPLPVAPKPVTKPKRIRIGYFSSDFQNHPVMFALMGILENHNSDKFEIYAYSFGPEVNDGMRLRVVNTVKVFNNVRGLTDRDVALLARKQKIDIAVDLTGYTKNSRTGIFAYRAAPIQVNYLGYPGTMGADFIDYMITDQNLLPPKNQKFISEKPIYMPNCVNVIDVNIPIAKKIPSRSELGLPKKAFIFCAINNSYKISPVEFDIWMRLLKSKEDSILWLLARNKWVKKNLMKEAKSRGIDPSRLIFQFPMVTDVTSQSNYLAQFKHADLYLDTFIYGAGSTANNALLTGLPVLTKAGQGLTTRMAATYLSALGLQELITYSNNEYESLALELSNKPKKLHAIKRKLINILKTTPLCNNELYTRHLETGYKKAYLNYFEGKSPEQIYI